MPRVVCLAVLHDVLEVAGVEREAVAHHSPQALRVGHHVPDEVSVLECGGLPDLGRRPAVRSDPQTSVLNFRGSVVLPLPPGDLRQTDTFFLSLQEKQQHCVQLVDLLDYARINPSENELSYSDF